ncbi:alpha/beta fold hydrolase [Amycolatopsis suaedae]|uniref:Alpha/beta hydrolase n=1 Tax=Amycolatopsis suaedae TaxID=2510978 RepID=A0A4Q7J121_9PSEU|nr:alpha/beta hydrolase [Amycolatopsis suaedae]RZQ60519.1 alpha/beta hydrolase [Amycolatopsis suaedae]
MDVILIPGLWLDGASWDAVLPALRDAGHRPHPVTLPGMESRSADRSAIGLRDHVDAVVALIDSLDGSPAVVGHSGGGAVAHAAVDARPGRVSHAVYVDCWPVGDGDAINTGLPADGADLPLPDWSFFDDEDLVDLDDELRARFRARAVPSPARVASDPQRLTDERRLDVPVTIVACEFPSGSLREWMAAGEPRLRELSRIRQVAYTDLPTGHWPQFTRPAELGRAIAGALPDWS